MSYPQVLVFLSFKVFSQYFKVYLYLVILQMLYLSSYNNLVFAAHARHSVRARSREAVLGARVITPQCSETRVCMCLCSFV